jgi:hypothetical protein
VQVISATRLVNVHCSGIWHRDEMYSVDSIMWCCVKVIAVRGGEFVLVGECQWLCSEMYSVDSIMCCCVKVIAVRRG